MLEKIQSPEDIRGLSVLEMKALCEEMRGEILRVVSKNGGHLASNLGIVEATLLLHRVFHSPEDKILFDVGHQCYPHKLLTGRYDRFDTLRKQGGISGFPSRRESEHDILVEGHSGTSVSAALGIAEANKLLGSEAYTIAVVGDGALTNGMIYEALNNAADREVNLIIVINDNEMSISPNIGGLHRYLSRIRTSKKYFRLKRGMEKFLVKIPLVGWGLAVGLKRMKDFFKLLFVKNNLFEDLGLIYLGPVDGHDMNKLETVFEEAKLKHRACIVHINTKKGKGYEKAENEPHKYHGVAPFDPEKGIAPSGKSFTSVMGALLTEKAKADESLCAVTAAMRDGTGLSSFANAYPDRFFDVGIAEEHAVTFSAGLARGGMKPVLALYSTFAQRAYDQLIHDIAIQELSFLLLLDRAGLVPGDGITHQGIFDYPILSSIPNIHIYSPETYEELRSVFNEVYDRLDFSVIRYPRGAETVYTPMKRVKVGNILEYSEGIHDAKTVIVTYGRVTKAAEDAMALSDGCVGLLKLIRIFPLDMDEILSYLTEAETVYFLEEGYREGGVSEKIASALQGEKRIIIHAVEEFPTHGTLEELFSVMGFTGEAIAERIKDL